MAIAHTAAHVRFNRFLQPATLILNKLKYVEYISGFKQTLRHTQSQPYQKPKKFFAVVSSFINNQQLKFKVTFQTLSEAFIIVWNIVSFYLSQHVSGKGKILYFIPQVS